MSKEELLKNGSRIGNDVFFGTTVYVDPGFERFLEIEDGAVISNGTSIILHDSSLNNILGLPIKIGKVKICKNAYIGVNTTILCGVEIGENSLIGAGSLVTKNIPPNTVAYGSPVKIISSLSDFKDRYIKNMKKSNYFYWDVIPWRERKKCMTQTEEQKLYSDFIYKIKDHIFADAPYCIDFSDTSSSRYLVDGWYNEENWPPIIRWTGKRATAYIKIAPSSKKMLIKFFINHDIDYKIFIEKREVDSRNIKKAGWIELEESIPSNIDANIIEIIVECDTWIPDDIIKNGDMRELGIAVEKIWIE